MFLAIRSTNGLFLSREEISLPTPTHPCNRHTLSGVRFLGWVGGSFDDCAALIMMMCHCSLLLSPFFFPLWPNRQNINHFDLFGDMSTPPSVRAATQTQNIHEPKLMEADKIAKTGRLKLIYFREKRPETSDCTPVTLQ